MAAVISPLIPYFPSDGQKEAFWVAISKSLPTTGRVPLGFPRELHSALAWKANDIASKLSAYETRLDGGDIDAIDSALAAFKATSLSFSEISTKTFPLPEPLAQKLKAICDECYQGVGFNVLRGLDPSKHTNHDNIAIYAGIAAHVAPQRGFVDRKRHLLHVASAKTPAFTTEKVAFHSDNSEIMGLYVLESADEGGHLALSSSYDLYNELAHTRPEILETLATPWVLDTFKDYAKYPPLRIPFLHPSGCDKIVFRFSRYPMTGFQNLERNPTLPLPTKAQIEAMDAVHFMALANSIQLPIGRGDIVFINDQAILHARGTFQDVSGSGRHLLKMFLRDPDQSWPVSGPALEQQLKIYGPNRDDGTREETWWVDFETGQEEEAPTNG
ncbi:hypothetical protein F5Y19DRAFT_488381 [Xylariaceae sp. FL1651]|nr:hypothetical protein F5Y19DRAFT_488381 [Xylariaceae sp. FL1651]